MHTREGLLLNIVVGIAGEFVAGLVLTPLLGVGTINQNDFSSPALLVSLLGAIILLALVQLSGAGASDELGLRHGGPGPKETISGRCPSDGGSEK